jgi:hypothetical protein
MKCLETAAATHEDFPTESQQNQAWRIKFQDFLDSLPNNTRNARLLIEKTSGAVT